MVLFFAIENIINSPYFTLSSFFIGILGLIFGILSWRSAFRIRKPVYTVSNFNLVRNFKNIIPGIHITYKDREIENITISKIAFWNKGLKTINKEDIIKSDPLRIRSVKGVVILDRKVIHTTEPANMFQAQEIDNPNSFLITFDYLGRGDGAIIEIVHTGTGVEDIFLSGKIKEVKEFEYRKLKIVHRTRHLRLPGNIKLNLSDNILGIFFILFLICFFGYSLFYFLFIFPSWGMVILILVLIIFFSTVLKISEIPEELGELVQRPW
jgi:hypothetical protein